jgi:hypothetical protein
MRSRTVQVAPTPDPKGSESQSLQILDQDLLLVSRMVQGQLSTHADVSARSNHLSGSASSKLAPISQSRSMTTGKDFLGDQTSASAILAQENGDRDGLAKADIGWPTARVPSSVRADLTRVLPKRGKLLSMLSPSALITVKDASAKAHRRPKRISATSDAAVVVGRSKTSVALGTIVSIASSAAARLEGEQDVDETGQTPLLLSLAKGQLELATDFLDSGHSPDQINPVTGVCPLVLVIGEGDMLGLELLLDRGANPNLQDFAGLTPLHHAVLARNEPMVRELLGYGADLHVANSSGETPLMLACGGNLVSIASLLVEKGAEVNHQSASGATPLMYAAQNDAVGVVHILLEADCDLHLRNFEGLKPFEIAVSYGSYRVANVLLKLDRVQHTGFVDAFAQAMKLERLQAGESAPMFLAGTVPEKVSAIPESYGLGQDVWKALQDLGITSMADRLANVASLNSSADLFRISRKSLIRAGLSPVETTEFFQAIRAALIKEAKVMTTTHMVDEPRSQLLPAVDLGSCCSGCFDDAPYFGEGIEDRAVIMAHPEDRKVYYVNQVNRAIKSTPTVEAEEAPSCLACFDNLEPQGGCCGAAPGKWAIRAVGGVVADDVGIEFYGREGTAGMPKRGSTPTPAQRWRLQMEAFHAHTTRESSN